MRKLVSSGSPFEPRIGFSRAARVINRQWLVEVEADCVADVDA